MAVATTTERATHVTHPDRPRQPPRSAPLRPLPYRGCHHFGRHDHCLQEHDPQDPRRKESAVRGQRRTRGADTRSAGRVFAQKLDNGDVVGVGFPRPLNDCKTCHSDGPTVGLLPRAAAGAACATCHDDVNPSLQTTAAGPPGTNHFQSKGFSDGECIFCHTAEAQQEFDISVPGAHVIPERSAQLAGLNVDITDIANNVAGQAPTVSFKVTDDAGTPLLDLSGLNRLGITFAGPTTDYQRVMALTAVGGGSSGTVTGPDADGVFEYTPASVIPADAMGSWTVGAEARRLVDLVTSDPNRTIEVEEAAPNPVMDFSVDGSDVLARRTVVADDHCQVCHGEFSKGFSIHGNLRNRVDYCVMCHNPNATDAARRPAGSTMVTPIDFKVMIHKIHRGENLAMKPYIIYGFGSTRE